MDCNVWDLPTKGVPMAHTAILLPFLVNGPGIYTRPVPEESERGTARVTGEDIEEVTRTLNMCALYHEVYKDTPKAVRVAKRRLEGLKNECKAMVRLQIILWAAVGF